MSASSPKELVWIASSLKEHTVRFAEAVYVLHAFQKKSKRGVATPKNEIEIVNARLELARQIHAQRTSSSKGDTK